jgi:hypothetical protein
MRWRRINGTVVHFLISGLNLMEDIYGSNAVVYPKLR